MNKQMIDHKLMFNRLIVNHKECRRDRLDMLSDFQQNELAGALVLKTASVHQSEFLDNLNMNLIGTALKEDDILRIGELVRDCLVEASATEINTEFDITEIEDGIEDDDRDINTKLDYRNRVKEVVNG